MQGKKAGDVEGLIVGVGITGGRKSKDILSWAVDNFLPPENANVNPKITFRLLHVYPKITSVPTPMGNWLPIAQVRDDLAAKYREEVEWKKKKAILPFQQALKARKLKSEIVMLESDDIAMAIILEVERLSIRHLIVGVSSTSIFSRKGISLRKMLGENQNVSAVVSETAPDFCTVYIISDGKLQHMRPADAEQPTVITVDYTSSLSTASTDSSSSLTIGRLLKSGTSSNMYPSLNSSQSSVSTRYPMEYSGKPSHYTYSDTKTDQNVTDSSFASQGSSSSGSWLPDRTSPGGSLVGTPPTGSFASTPPSGSFVGTPPGRSFIGSPSQQQSPGVSGVGSSPHQLSQLERLRIELRHAEQMYELAQSRDMNEKRQEEAMKLEEEEKAKALESKAEENMKKAKQILIGPISQYQKFTWEEIVKATSSFSEEFKIGMGAFGTVFKCKLHHTTVAVKVLHSKNSATNKQFLQELEILTSIRHPHLLLLLGAAPEESCLVYEYMEHGSLEDRLFRKGNTSPLLWYDRFRICYEVASALVFLHSTKPKPIIHRDLKPANILLDQHLVSKIGDAGLGTMINVEPSSMSLKTLYKETSPVGTLCYIDPEYQRTGRVSTKSDIYALGVVILQLLTAKPAVGIAYLIEDAIDEENLIQVLDTEAGQWPEKETLELALLGLQCAELRGRDRPDLREKVLPVLERLKEVADRARETAASGPIEPPAHFVCPILKDVIEDPYVAADGYTYDRKAIEQWLSENETSPTTNLPLPHKFIMPNYTLLEAIKQWKAKRQIK